MKKTIILTLIFLLSACSGEPFNTLSCYKSVEAAYPNSEISVLPGSKYIFLVRTENGDIFYVGTLSLTSAEVTVNAKVFSGD